MSIESTKNITKKFIFILVKKIDKYNKFLEKEINNKIFLELSDIE